jgi:sarcosine oxidase subunit beta
MTKASVAVIGAGVVGASVAYHLAARGWRDVVVLDRSGGPGQGSTGAATGGYRAQFTTAINVRLSLLAREKMLRFREEIGADPGYVPAGYLWLARGQGEMDALAAAREVQHAAGLSESRAVDVDEIRLLSPHVRLDGVVGGAFCPTDGFIKPVAILEGYLRAAERLGARVMWGSQVVGLRSEDPGRITEVETTRERISVDAVVNAAGAWARPIAALAGVDIPVEPARTQVAVTPANDYLPATMPMTIFVSDGFHFRARDRRVLLLMSSQWEPAHPYDVTVDPRWLDAVGRVARERIPSLREVPIDDPACWAGLYEKSPDRHAILGHAPGYANFYLANGSSGHGVMHAPALGHLLAEIMSDGSATTVDAAPLRPTRFAEGDLNSRGELL